MTIIDAVRSDVTVYLSKAEIVGSIATTDMDSVLL
jgi:hypothetical protein